MKLSNFAQDLSKAEDGVWVDLGDGLKVKVARSGSARADAVIKRLTKPYQRQIYSGAAPDALLERLNAEHTAEAILVAWEGLQDEDGVDIPYSKAKALELILNPVYRDFKDQVLSLAREAETFRKDLVKDTMGKSAVA